MDTDKNICEECDGTGWAAEATGVRHGGASEYVGGPCPRGCNPDGESHQEAFDTAVNHIRAQDYAPSTAYRGFETRCAYRGHFGQKCAIGCMIDDEYYSPAMEFATATDTIILDAIEASGYPHVPDLYLDLQNAHDELDSIGSSRREFAFERRIQRIARKYGLVYTPLLE